MRYLSVCSGIEAASVAWEPLGWTPIGFSEVDPFACAVLAHRFPHVKNYGDMTRHEEWDIEPGMADLLVGGTPCQSFSVAGLRQGLRDPRGNLMLVYLAIAARLRPRWIVWENVPGVLSSAGGRDFGTFLGALGELGYGWAYRVLDAQWVRTQRHPRAVPQRRRRVFVVGCLGDGAAPGRVLFERESVQRNPAPRREAGQGPAADVEGGAGSGWPKPVSATLNAHFGEKQGLEDQHALGGGSLFVPVLPGEGKRGDYETTTMVAVPYDLFQITAPVNRQNRRDGDPMHTLARDNAAHAAIVGTDCYNGAITGDVAATIGTPGSSVNASGPTVMSFKPGQSAAARTLCSRGDTPGGNQHLVPAVQQAMQVRRLTPRECERLQGFPDGWTLVPYRGKPAKDGPRYRAIGNSMAVNCMEWIGSRISEVDA